MTIKKMFLFISMFLCLSSLLTACTGGDSKHSKYTSPRKGESASDYIKRQDPELYAEMEDRWEAITGNKN